MFTLLFADPASPEVKILTPDGAVVARTVRGVPIGRQVWCGLKALNSESAVQRANLRGTWKISKPKLSDTGFAPQGRWLRLASSEAAPIDLAFPSEVPSDLVKALRGIFPQAKGDKMASSKQVKKPSPLVSPRSIPGKGTVPQGKSLPKSSGGGVNVKK